MDWYKRESNNIDRTACIWGIVNGKKTKAHVVIKTVEHDTFPAYTRQIFGEMIGG